MRRTRITAVSYLNTKPLLYGLVRSELYDSIDLSLDIPSEGARKLIAGEVDLGLVPVAVIPEIPDARVISDYCIGAVGAVKTVGIYSRVPIEEVTRLHLDFHSRTSIQLAQVLLREYWHAAPKLVPATPDFLQHIGPTEAAVVIGDRTIGLETQFPYFYDLSEHWQHHTGLPFVFAAWVARGELPEGFEDRFNRALHAGVQAIDELQYLLPSPHPDFSLTEYFTRYISYDLSEEKRRALCLFLEKIDVENARASSSPAPEPISL